ncbi:MAG: hypothetical protein J5I81_01590 [Nitrococcus mobilis]|nr:hypothetical protein [Nitrococcus mobilis]
MAIVKAKRFAIPRQPMERLSVDAAARRNSSALHHLHRQLVRRRNYRSFSRASGAVIAQGIRPLTSFVRVWRSTRTYGPEVARLAGVPLWRQLLQQWLIAMRFGFSSDAYYRYRLYRLDNLADAELFFPLNVNMMLRTHLYQRLNVDTSRLIDKRIFHRVCTAHQLPVAVIVAEFTAGAARAWPDGGEVTLPRGDLFSKPADSLCGEGVARWIWQEDGYYRSEGGEALTADELCDHLKALSHSGGSYLLQRRLANHPSIASLGPGALCTARIVTCRKVHGQSEHMLSVFRMPPESDAAPADNFALGGFASPIDEATGVLRDAVRKDLHYAAVDYHESPHSGRPFAGYRLPYWKAALELCLRAHDVFSEFPSVGWDVAITPDGPVLLEGNHDWDVVLAQQPGARPLGRTMFVASYHSFHALGA